MRKIFYGWWIVCACFLIAFYVGGIIFYGFTAFIEPLIKEFGWSYAKVSFAASLRGLEMGILAPFVGLLADRWGSRKLLLGGIIILGSGTILLGITQSLAMFYGAFLLIAFGAGGCTSVVTMTAVANWFEHNIGKAMGLMASGFGASGLMVPVIVWLIGAYGWRTACFMLGAGMWMIGVPLTFVIRNNPEDHGYIPDGVSSEPSGAVAGNRWHNREIQFKSVLRTRSYAFVNLAEAIRMMTLSAVVTHIMPYLSSTGMSRTSAGLVAAGIPLISILGRFGLGWLGDFFEKKYVMAAAHGLMALGMLSLSYVEVGGFIYAFLFLFSVGFGGLAVLRGALIRDYYGRVAFGKLIGIVMGSAACGGIIGPTVAGWVFDTMGSYVFIWQVLCGFSVVAVLFILTIQTKQNSNQ
ncbi:MAG: MFS transporter [Deltaproteobacteria bacterium]|nr:MFS transporter [Deltaproteobacteria bacterium]MBW1994090.1 MFS transporter [Deltaproteobacteria bacterium]